MLIRLIWSLIRLTLITLYIADSLKKNHCMFVNHATLIILYRYVCLCTIRTTQQKDTFLPLFTWCFCCSTFENRLKVMFTSQERHDFFCHGTKDSTLTLKSSAKHDAGNFIKIFILKYDNRDQTLHFCELAEENTIQICFGTTNKYNKH